MEQLDFGSGVFVTERKYNRRIFSGFYGPKQNNDRWQMMILICRLKTEKTQ